MRLSRLVLLILTITSAAPQLRAQVADVLSFMLSQEKADTTKPDHTAGVLDFLSTPATPFNTGALDFITGAYSSTGYYRGGFSRKNVIPSPAPYHGPLIMPGWGRITSSFGYRENFGRMHEGIDVSMSVGDTVRSPLPGTVYKVKYEPKGYGHYVVLLHDDGMETRYAHLSRPLVSPGETVAAGQPIALSGSTGNSTGPHLHFETRHQGVAVDPRSVFDLTNPAASQTPVPSTKAKSLGGKSTYIVRQGDTVKTIARRAGLTTLRLCQLNFITEDTELSPGTMLKLK